MSTSTECGKGLDKIFPWCYFWLFCGYAVQLLWPNEIPKLHVDFCIRQYFELRPTFLE